MKGTVVFVCPHGAGKSVLAAAYFQQLAGQAGLALHATAVGIDPEAAVPAPVVALFQTGGIDVRTHRPRRVMADEFTEAVHVVSRGCDVQDLGGAQPIEHRDDVPLVSADVHPANMVIRACVAQFVTQLTAQRGSKEPPHDNHQP